MKITPKTTVSQHLKGSISAPELLALVRQTVEIQEGAEVRFYVEAPASRDVEDVNVDADTPLRFEASWSLQKTEHPEQALDARAFATVKFPPEPVKPPAEPPPGK